MLANDVDEEPPSGVEEISTNENIATSEDSGNYALSGSDVKLYYKGNANYEVVLSQNSQPVNNASLIVKINGVTYNKTTDSNGKVSIPLNLNVGTFTASAFYSNVTSITNNIKVLPVITAKDITTTYKSSKEYSAKFLDSNGNLKTAFIKPYTKANIEFCFNDVSSDTIPKDVIIIGDYK